MLERLLWSQGSYVLPATVLAVALGTLILLPLLSFVSTTFQVNRSARERELALYAAEAGVRQVIADMIRGADAIPTTYIVEQPHAPGESFLTFEVNTSYTIPSVAVNGFIPTITLQVPTTAPAGQQQYVDPGLLHPDLATVEGGAAFLMRLYQVQGGELQVNWAYSPAGITRVGVWKGMPVDPSTDQPFPPGRLTQWPREHPILDTGFSPAIATSNRTEALDVEPGVYTIVFDNSRGKTAKTTAPFAPTGGPDDTWIWTQAYRDYLITATAGAFELRYLARQVPGYTEPPTGDWSTTNPSFITNGVYVRTWTLAQGP